MGEADSFNQSPGGSHAPGGLLDLLGVAAVALDATGRIVLWSPQAEQLFGYTADEALGRYAGRLMVDPEHLPLVMELFSEVMETGRPWAGGFPIRCKDGSLRQVEFRNMRLQDEHHHLYALGIATDQTLLRRVETDLALSVRLVDQSPIGLAILDTDLRYVVVNPALERLHARAAADLVGRQVSEVLSPPNLAVIEPMMRQVLDTGVPLLNVEVVGRLASDPDRDHAWSLSYYRLDTGGHVLGVAVSVVDVTERHQAASEAACARRRLALISDASVRIGTTLDLRRTAHELAEMIVPELADLAAVDVLDSILNGGQSVPSRSDESGALFRPLAVAAADPLEAVPGADGEILAYDADRLITRCVNTARPILMPQVDPRTLRRIARDDEAAAQMARAGVHSYLTVPLIARGEVIGALDMARARNPVPFDHDDLLLAGELATRAAVCIDNARSYSNERATALTLQRSLLSHQPPDRPGLQIAYRYWPAEAALEVGGDWFDVIALPGAKTGLVVGDVMGSGIAAAAAMGQLRMATRTLAVLDLDPSEVLDHLDAIATDLELPFATCVYAVYDPERDQCAISTAGHLPPVLIAADGPPTLIEVPPGAPLGVGGVAFTTITLPAAPGSRLVLYTDGLIETRDDPIDERLQVLCHLLDGPRHPMEETCEELLRALRHPDDPDDVLLLIADLKPSAAPVFTPSSRTGDQR